MELIYGAIATVLAAAIAVFGTLRVAGKTKSGKIDTSEAATLWDEGTKMRIELRNEVESLKIQVAEFSQEVKAAREDTMRAREETRQSREETRQLMLQIDKLHKEVKTYNTLTMGALADNAETRRILLIDKEDRTDVEFNHIATAGQRQPEGEHPVIPPEELRDGDVQIEKEPDNE